MVKIEYIVLEFHQGYDFFFHKIAIKNCINEVEIALQNEIFIFFLEKFSQECFCLGKGTCGKGNKKGLPSFPEHF